MREMCERVMGGITNHKRNGKACSPVLLRSLQEVLALTQGRINVPGRGSEVNKPRSSVPGI